MIHRLSRLWPGLFPWDEHPDLEIRLFRKVSLASAALAIGAIVPANYFQNLPASLSLAVFAFGMMSYALYRASLRGLHAAKTFCVLLLLLLDYSWFQNAGSKGTIGMFMFFAVMVLTTFFKGRVGWAALVVYLVNGLALLWVEHAFPHLVVPYAHEEDRLSDFTTSFVFSSLVCVLVLRVVLAAHDRERKRLAAQTPSWSRVSPKSGPSRACCPSVAGARKSGMTRACGPRWRITWRSIRKRPSPMAYAPTA